MLTFALYTSYFTLMRALSCVHPFFSIKIAPLWNEMIKLRATSIFPGNPMLTDRSVLASSQLTVHVPALCVLHVPVCMCMCCCSFLCEYNSIGHSDEPLIYAEAGLI